MYQLVTWYELQDFQSDTCSHMYWLPPARRCLDYTQQRDVGEVAAHARRLFKYVLSMKCTKRTHKNEVASDYSFISKSVLYLDKLNGFKLNLVLESTLKVTGDMRVYGCINITVFRDVQF
jgi:hypothetical protein